MINKFFKKASILLTALSIIYVVFVGYQNWIDLREVVNTEGYLLHNRITGNCSLGIPKVAE